MARCLVIGVDNYLKAENQPLTGCQFIAMEYQDYQLLNSLSSSVGSDITIDSDVYVTVTGYLLLSFVSGHVLGRILKTFGKG
ncbi:hypothetical protein AAFX24_00040 [Vibrio mediterranei]|jgi:hypothetical protein|uniref:Uncharacterized protein n=1 Tax=Vibrio mediterranei TaxID=689 RepID=A0A3G4V6D5_9VIBR|nr:hypothetical protein [Vibrio mediterranei]AYV19849.1 hypothetical protein ECB94_00435 [Vibrio mediterranei]AYV19859.1 hypothetical protein ECB94_00490 [Vibrio mediterranei]EDL50929.1 hypothetical protein VSAK1_24710 [Vibrio mediterranei AK1]